MPTGVSYDVQTIMTCYILNMITNDKIIFKALPEDVSESYGASWDSMDIRGRSAPYHSYGGNESRSISFSITLHDDICDNLVSTVKSMKALVYPIYQGSVVVPPYCKVKIGSMVDCYAIVNSVSVTWGETILEDSEHMSKAEVSFDLTEIHLEGIPTATAF